MTTESPIYHISPQGDDAHPGTADQPWLTLHSAAERVLPGDTVLLHAGTYALQSRVHFKVGGAPDRWVTFAAAPGEEVTLEADAVRPSNGGEAARGVLQIEASYLRLVNLTLRNCWSAGIMVTKDCHDIDIAGCRVAGTFAPAIGAWNCARVRVISCEVTGANSQRYRLFGDPNHECPHEAISMAGVDGFEVCWNHVHHCEKEGIDVKEVSCHGTVHHNYVHDSARQGLYVDAWFGLLTDVIFRSNLVERCEWGIGVSVECRDSRLEDVRICNNILSDNRGSGIYFALWGVDGPRSDIRIDHNTLRRNGAVDHWSGPTGNIDLRSRNASNIDVAYNVCEGGGAFEVATGFDLETEPDAFTTNHIRFAHNFIARREGPLETRPYPAGYGSAFPVEGMDTLSPDAQPPVDTFVHCGACQSTADTLSPDAQPLVDAPVAPHAGESYTGAMAPGETRLPHVEGLTGFPTFEPDCSALPEAVARRRP